MRRAPRVRRLSLHHPSNSPLDADSLGLIRGLECLEHLSLLGDTFLYDEEFEELGKMSQLTSLRLGLP